MPPDGVGPSGGFGALPGTGASFAIETFMPIKTAIPVLRVPNVERSLQWYRGALGFVGDPFPAAPPYAFASLRQGGGAEIMMRRGEAVSRPGPRSYDWDVYLRLEQTPIRELHARFQAAGLVTRRLERMFYGLAEFEVTDPDGYVICLSQAVDNADDLPAPAV